jgi:hypothetical protein
MASGSNAERHGGRPQLRRAKKRPNTVPIGVKAAVRQSTWVSPALRPRRLFALKTDSVQMELSTTGPRQPELATSAASSAAQGSLEQAFQDAEGSLATAVERLPKLTRPRR